MKRVLFCTPYLQNEDVVSGGINMWGANILSFYESCDSNVSIDPVSFDRIFYVNENTSVISRFIYAFRDYRHAIRLTKKKLSSGRYDVMHLCSSAQLSLIKDLYLLNYARKRKIKAIIHLHFGRIPELFKKNNWEAKLLKKVCRAANIIIVMDENSYYTLQNYGFKGVHFLPNPLSPSIIKSINQVKVTKRSYRKLLFVGHIIPSKGVFELIEACATIPDVELHLIGAIDQTVKMSMTNLAKEVNFDGKLYIIGSLPHDEVIREMLTAAIFVLPSYTEGFPNVILEAMACGCPIVATNVGAIPQMLDIESEDNCGICVPPKNVSELKKAIIKLLVDRKYASQCGQNAKNRVFEQYSMPTIWRKLTAIWS